MKIQQKTVNLGQAPNGKARVTVASNPIREREMIDPDGNVIDPRTKRIIRRNTAN
jgi:hypothetical protein